MCVCVSVVCVNVRACVCMYVRVCECVRVCMCEFIVIYVLHDPGSSAADGQEGPGGITWFILAAESFC